MKDSIVIYFEFIQNLLVEENKELFENLSFEKRLKEYNPFSVIIAMFIFLYIMPYLRSFLFKIFTNLNSIHKIKIVVLNFLMNFNFAKNYMKKTKQKIKDFVSLSLKKDSFKKFEFKDEPADLDEMIINFPEMFRKDKEILKDNKITGGYYVGREEIEKVAEEVAGISHFTLALYSYSDLKSPNVFPSARQIEAKLIDIGIKLFKGEKNECVGVTSSGGTESIMLAVLAYRNLGFERGISEPEVIFSVYTHAAFQKACDAYKIKYVVVDVDQNTHKIDIKKMKKAINKNTICVVGNFPNYPNGVCDDIDIMGEICEELNIPLHIDSCLGGMLIAFANDSGIKGIPKCDFQQKGITSISCDYHKYGQAPKGISLLLYRSKFYRKYQYFKYDKLNGPNLTPGINGTRNACFNAATLAVLIYNGRIFYVNQARDIHNEILRLTKFTEENLPLIKVVGEPKVCVISFTGPKINEIYSKMGEKHWDISYIAQPVGFHLALTAGNLRNVINKKFENDLKDSYDYVIMNPNFKASEVSKLYGISAALPQEIAKNNLDILVDGLLE